MIEVTLAGVVAYGATAMGGAVIGAVAVGVCAMGKVRDLTDAYLEQKKVKDDWHGLWRKVNNTFNLYKVQAREIKVCINGKGGRRVWMSAHEAIEYKLREVNNG